jgi:hypothetical protein
MDGKHFTLRRNVCKASSAQMKREKKTIVTPAHVEQIMGLGKKVRSFYNCILDSDADKGEETTDTHMAGAALLRPLCGQTLPTWHTLGTSPKQNQKPPSG